MEGYIIFVCNIYGHLLLPVTVSKIYPASAVYLLYRYDTNIAKLIVLDGVAAIVKSQSQLQARAVDSVVTALRESAASDDSC